MVKAMDFKFVSVPIKHL